MYDIIIIGAGPAGLTAAIYACRFAKSVLVLEAKNYGGQIINSLDIENYPSEEHISGFDFATKIYNQAKNLGAKFVFEKVININNIDSGFEVLTTNNSYVSKAVIIATGSKNKTLSLQDEDKLIGKGVSYCATCDGHFFKNKSVAVIGGGNTAFEDALYLSDIVSKLYLIHRRDEFRADKTLVNQLRQKRNVEFIYNSIVSKLNHSDKLDSINVLNNLDNSKVIPVDGVFVAIGRIPENEVFSKFVKLDDNGYIIAGEDCHTNVSGIFVAGDNRSKTVRQLVTATADGAVAAVEAVKYINSLKK